MTMGNRQLIKAIIQDLEQLGADVAWAESQLDGRRGRRDTVNVTGGGHPDPTGDGALSIDWLEGRLHALRRDLTWLWQHKMPGLARRLQTVDHLEHAADANDGRTDPDGRDLGPARIDGGISAYRGDHTTPPGRPDLADALGAQQRRLDRGEGYGAA